MASYSKSERASIIAKANRLMSDGMPHADAAIACGVHGKTLRNWGAYSPRKVGGVKGHRRRFTDLENAFIEDAFCNYVPIENIAAALNTSYGNVRYKIWYWGLRRNASVLAAMKRVPNFVRRAFFTKGEEAFLRLVSAYDRAQSVTDTERTQYLTRARLAGKQFPGLSRDDVIREKRALGMTLEAIAQQYSITRERVRQICLPSYVEQQRNRYRKHINPNPRKYVRRKQSYSRTRKNFPRDPVKRYAAKWEHFYQPQQASVTE